MVWTLGLETATWTASVGVAADGRVVAERAVRTERSHSPTLIPLIDEVLAAAGIAVVDLDAVAVSAGPGSFTGLRVGLSTAKGLAYAATARVVAVPTLEALVRAAGPRDGVVWAILDARRGEVYAASFRWQAATLVPCSQEQAIAPSRLGDLVELPCTFVGDGVDVYGDQLRARFGASATLVPLAVAPPSGGVVAQMGWERLGAGEVTDLAALEPRYVRPSEAELKAGHAA